MIEVDVENRILRVDLSDEVLAERRANWQAPVPNYTSGVLAKYAKLAQQADDGAVSNIL